MRFKEIIEDIRYTFKTGGIRQQGLYSGIGRDEKRVTTLKEIVLYGSKARGAGYRVRKALQNEFDFVPVASPDQEIPELNQPTVFYIDVKRIGKVPERFRKYAKEHANASILVVDVNGKEKHAPGFSYTIDANYFIHGLEKDIDPIISRTVAELYINVYHAVDEEGIEIPKKGLVKPYFKTSFLIDYDRTRDILEGIISSVVRKFDPDVIASREIVGIAPEDVKMYELARPIAERLKIQSAMLEKQNGDYAVIKGDVRGKRALLLDDVVGDAGTKIKLVKAIRKREGVVNACVVLLDRKEGARERLEKEGVELYSLTDLATYQRLAAERKTA